MSILNKLMDTMRLTENDDDYFDEEDYEEEKPVIKKRSFGKRDEEMITATRRNLSRVFCHVPLTTR